MAKIVFDPAIRVVSGNIGNFVYRKQADDTIIMAKTALPNPDREPTEAQAGQMQRFKQASARCQRLLEDAELKEAYEKLLAGLGPKARLRALVMGDILKAPQISSLDILNFDPSVGGTIRVTAEDNVGVCRLELYIQDEVSGAELLNEQKVMNGSTATSVEWEHVMNVEIPEGHQAMLCVRAFDLAGNQAEMTQYLN